MEDENICSLHRLIALHAAKLHSGDTPVQVVVHPGVVESLLAESEGEFPFEFDGTGGYVAFGLPVFLDPNCPGAVVMGTEQQRLWEEHWAANMPFGSLSLR